MYNLEVKKIIFVILFGFLFLTFKTSVFAEKIDSFDVTVVAHKDGSMSVNESIDYNFEFGDRHGIYRYIPLYSMIGDLYRIINIDNVSIQRDGKKEQFDKSADREQIYLKIGNPNKTITGAHNYKISYTVENGIGSNFPDHDEIYWNATGNGWDVPIEKGSIKITNDFGAEPKKLICFTGDLGSKLHDCTISGESISLNKPLSYNQGLTAVAVYPKGTFPASILSKTPPKTFGDKVKDFFLAHIILIYFILNIILPIGIIIWYERHKNKNRFGPPVVNFDIPKDSSGQRISPALAGTIDNGKLDRDDVVATLFDLAIRKYIKLEEIVTKRDLLPDTKKQKIIKLKENDGGLNRFELTLFDRLFEDGGDYVFADDLKKDFYETYQDLETEAFRVLVSKKYFVRNPETQKAFLVMISMISLFTFNFILGGVLYYLSKKLIGRTQLGDEADYKIDGLKLFLKAMDRNYNWQAEKFYTVEQMIPYAMSLGYIDRFMEQIKIIKPNYNPTWYTGYNGSFYNSYGVLFSSMNSNFTTSAPSSSSGAGGGFSGGGGGGGGGGSW